MLVYSACSCSTYATRIKKYHDKIAENKFDDAIKEIERIKWLKIPRNQFLYYAEKALVYHLAEEYDSSNFLFEKADEISQKYGKSVGDVAKAYLLNPMMEKYKGQEFEKFLLHYYKILNYISLRQPDDALVEVRQMSIVANALKDKRTANSKKYKNDAFSYFMQGLLYASNGNTNDAFIAYRNALDVFREKNNLWYGIRTPQLLVDAFYATGKKMFFSDELDYYKKEMNLKFAKNSKTTPPPGGYLYLFIESGLAPKKSETKNLFNATPGEDGQFEFRDASLIAAIPLLYTLPAFYSKYSEFASYITSLYVSIPFYIPSEPTYDEFTASSSTEGYVTSSVLDINTLAIQTLEERKPEIILAALGRAAVRMLLKAATSEALKDDSKSDQENDDAALISNLLIDVFSFIVEKADTRNWQSLPSKIYCMRVPLQKGVNNITINASSTENIEAEDKSISLQVTGGNRPIQIKSIRLW